MDKKRIKEEVEKALYIDWAFKDVHGKPDKIIISGYPKGAYHLGYDEFINRVVDLILAVKETTK